MERQQSLDAIEKDIASALQFAGNALMELSKDKSSMKQVEGHATQFLKLLNHVERELNNQISYLTQVSTGHSHEGSSYASQKSHELARFRLDCMRYHISELDNLKNSRAGRIATAAALAPPPPPQVQPESMQQQTQMMQQQVQTPPSQQSQQNFAPQQMGNQNMMGGMQIPSGPMSAGQMGPMPSMGSGGPIPIGPMSQGQIAGGQMGQGQMGPGQMGSGQIPSGPMSSGQMAGQMGPGSGQMGQQQMFQQQQMSQQIPQYMSPHHSMGHHNMMNQ